MQGTIKTVYTERFFGFITGEDNQDYFFHGSQLISEQEEIYIHIGDLVEFDPVMSSKGLHAEKVRIMAQNDTEKEAL